MNRAVQHHRLVRDHRHLSRAFDERVRAASFVGQSHVMVEVFKLVGKVAPGRTSVLIQGESGTGKEVIARAIHDNSLRAARLFVAVNCSAIPDALLESELFGHVKGSFTGADAFRRGLLEEASGGTLFLDEVADLSSSGQAKLLRALQEQEIRRVGSNETVKLDLRVISASRRNLHQLVSAGQFREDLLYRLNTVTTTIPPLRERPEDIPLLAELFLARYGGQKLSLSPPSLPTRCGHYNAPSGRATCGSWSMSSSEPSRSPHYRPVARRFASRDSRGTRESPRNDAPFPEPSVHFSESRSLLPRSHRTEQGTGCSSTGNQPAHALPPSGAVWSAQASIRLSS